MQGTFLHDAGSRISDAVAQLTRFLWIRRNLGALGVEFVFNLTAIPIYASHIGGRGRVD